ncbi:hypothetical protein J6TS2_50980 [Heyndrickxia sporothermodurans]|nr:hypothetical protein J6TS2_50980 [Heyndrickxia sporothermodurans]
MYTFGPNTGYDAWKEDKEKHKKKEAKRVKQGLPAKDFNDGYYKMGGGTSTEVQYRDPNFRATSDNPKKASFQWEKDFLRPLSSRRYGRSYDKKFESAVRELGGSREDVESFRKFLDAREKGMQTKSGFMDNLLLDLNKRDQKSMANYKKNKNDFYKKDTPKEKPKPSFFEDLGSAAKAAGQFFNPFDDVSAKEAVENFLNRDRSKAFDEVARGSNRTIDSATLGALSNLDKKINKREPYYKSDRKIGEGGVTDLLTSGAGYLAPGIGAFKAVRGAGLGVKEGAKGLTKLRQLAQEGALTGLGMSLGEVGIREALNPKDHTAKENLKDIALNTALGAVGDPLLHGLGKGANKLISKAIKGEVPNFTGKPSVETLKKLDPKQKELLKEVVTNPNAKESKDLLKQLEPIMKQNEKLKIEPSPLKLSEADTQMNPKKFEAIEPLKEKSDLELIEAIKPAKKETAAAYEAIEPLIDNGGKLKLKPQPINEDIKYNPNEVLPDTSKHIVSKTKKELPSFKSLKEKAYIKAVDDIHPLNEFDKTVEKVLGRKLNSSESSYTLAMNARGADQIAKQALTEKMINKNGEVVGNSLKDVVSQIPKSKYDEFGDYLINRHAIYRQNRGERVFAKEMKMNAEKSEAKVKQYEEANPEFKKIAEQNDEYNKKLAETWLVDENMISKKQWETYLQDNPNYVPMNRLFKDIEKGSFTNSAKKGHSNQSNPVKKVSPTGSERPIIDPIESQIEHTEKYIKTAKRNEVMVSIIRNVEKDPEAFKGIVEIVPTKETPNEIMDILKNDGVDGVLENFNKAFEQKPDLNKGNIVFGMIDGKKVHVKVHDPHLLEAITNLAPGAQHIVVKSVGQVTRFMKNLTTGINPVFGLARNIWRDGVEAFAYSKTTNNPLRYAADLVDCITSVMAEPLSKNKTLSKVPGLTDKLKKRAELYNDYKNVGGGHSSSISSDVNLLAQSKRSILPQKKGVRTLPAKGLAALENFNNILESAPRLGEFKRLTKNDKSYDAKMKGLFEANDITVNFNKRGNVTKEVDAFIPYLNAAVQGLDKFGRSFKSNPIATTVKGFTAITIPTVVLYAINHNDPNYQKVSNRIKDNNFLIPNGDGTFTKIPKPMEMGTLFGSGVERVLRKMKDDDPKAFEDFSKTVIDNFVPPRRTVLHPAFVDTVANKNFMDAPIVPGDLQNLSPRYQYDAKTSEVSKKVGDILNISPKKLDYLIQSYTGVIGELGVPATTKNGTIKNNLIDTLKQKVTTDPVFSNDLLTKFYEKKEKLDTAQADYSKQGIKSKNLNDELRKDFNQTSKAIGETRKEIKSIQADTSLTPEERQKAIKDLQKRINMLAELQLDRAR